MIFVDASAIVAILTDEDDAGKLTTVIENAPSQCTSPLAIFESTLGICRKRHSAVSEAYEDVLEFLRIANVRTITITESDAQIALDAFARYGKGRGHPAQLNLGDCFAYAVAVNNTASLLFKGDDFVKTDVKLAI